MSMCMYVYVHYLVISLLQFPQTQWVGKNLMYNM